VSDGELPRVDVSQIDQLENEKEYSFLLDSRSDLTPVVVGTVRAVTTHGIRRTVFVESSDGAECILDFHRDIRGVGHPDFDWQEKYPAYVAHCERNAAYRAEPKPKPFDPNSIPVWVWAVISLAIVVIWALIQA
jgi:hypothetical protein